MLQHYETTLSRADAFHVDHDFETRLLECIDATTSFTVDEWRITPAQAEMMLAWNNKNRSLNQALVERIRRDMANGNWHYTGEPIIFSNERLLDGQHRLHGCVAAGVPFVTNVTFGVEDDSWSYIDVGTARSPGDVFKIHGVKSANDMAAASRLIYSYEIDRVREQRGLKGKLNHEELYAKYLTYDGIHNGLRFAVKWREEKLCGRNAVIAAFYICQKIDATQAEIFFSKVGSNLNFSGPNDPALVLLKFFRKRVSEGHSIRNYDAVAAILTAWNSMRAGRSPRKLPFEVGDHCPRAK
jgi:hypothetical protein